MSSKGFCASFGKGKVFAIAILAPAAIYCAENLALTQSAPEQPHVSIISCALGAYSGFVLGMIGFIIAARAHDSADRKGLKLKTSAKKNDQRAKVWQMCAFATTVGLGAIFNGFACKEIIESSKESHAIKVEDCADGRNDNQLYYDKKTYECSSNGTVKYL
tara:strand:+ start:216 stop:698 length:483 start_codon:yes stop_codon:yes gene_type:complete